MKLNGLGILMSGFAARVARALSRLISGIGRHRGIFYVNGAGTLPPPLTSDEEARVIAELDGNGGGAARQTLIEHNLRLVAYIVNKNYPEAVRGCQQDADDLISIGTIGLIRAAETFDYTKGRRFSTYASRCIDNAITHQRKRIREFQ